MGPVASGFDRRSIWPWLAIVFTLVAATFQLDYQGRLWLCSCGQFLPWVGEARSSNTSQHLLDPYSFTHVLHGFVMARFFGLGRSLELFFAVEVGLLFWIRDSLILSVGDLI